MYSGEGEGRNGAYIDTLQLDKSMNDLLKRVITHNLPKWLSDVFEIKIEVGTIFIRINQQFLPTKEQMKEDVFSSSKTLL